MLVLFLFLGLKLHSNYDLRTQETNGGIKETIQTENQLKSKITKMTPKKKEGGRYKCDAIKFSYPKEMNLQEKKRFLLETDTDYEAFLKCENAKYNPNQNNVEIEGTIMNSGAKHILDRNPDALIVIRNADFKCSSSAFQASTSSNNDAQIIHFMGEGIHTITNTDFKLSGKNSYRFLKEDEHLLEEIDPTLIVFDDSSMNTIQGGQFSNPENETPARFIRTKKTSTLVVSGTDFYNATSIHRGSFLLLESSEKSSIINCRFISGYDKDNCAHGIFAKQGEVKILQCNFDKVMRDSSSEGSIILSETKRFEFEENSIKFNNPFINCRFLYLPSTGTYNIRQNVFQNLKLNEKGNAIYIETPSELLFENNEFENITGNTKIHGLHLTINNLGERPLIGNKFKNIASADGFLYIKAEDTLDNITFDKWKFIGVEQNGGGIINVDNSNNKPYILIFSDCYFDSNSNTNGGCLLINEQTFPNCRGLNLNDCDAFFNTATGKGSVIAAFFDGDINLYSCDFNLNNAGEGAVIYVEPPSQAKGTCSLERCNFNRNNGKESHCIWVNANYFNDDYSLVMNYCGFANNNDEKYPEGTNCLSNCYRTKAYQCNFFANEIDYTCGGINVTAKGILEVKECNFTKCSAGSVEGSYGGGIGYSYLKTGESDRGRVENISITDCEFNGGTGTNGVALLLNVLTINVYISDIQILNHQNTNYIFCLFFNCEVDNENFTLFNAIFSGNSYDSKSHDGDCGGSGIWIAEARSQDYLQSLTVIFDTCTFENNHSPVSGGAFGYDTSERLKAVELEFKGCNFAHNSCEGSGGACHFATKKTVKLEGCHFVDNTAESSHAVTGGGAIEFYASVELATIIGCTFDNCKSSKGSFIYTNGAVRGFDVRDCKFENLVGTYSSSVHLDVDSSAKTFIFENNDFINLECSGEYGGSGLHIGTGRDCEVTSCTFRGNKGDGQIIVPENSNKKLIFIRCLFEKGDGGSRALYVQGEAPIEFETCTFQHFNDIQGNPTIKGILVYSLAEKDALFNNCTFNDIHFLSALDYERSLKIEITMCNFTKVESWKSNVGGLLFITNAREFSLTDCKLLECGSIDRINSSCFNLCPSIDIAYISNCNFTRCGRCSTGACISARGISDIKIINSTFQRNMAQGKDGDTLSVYIDKDTKKCEISNCEVHTRENKNMQANDIFQFRVFALEVIFTNNIFDKIKEGDANPEDKGFGGIHFSNAQKLVITYNIFETRNTALYVENTADISIYNNTWQECYGKDGKGPRAFYIKTTNNLLTFCNNTVKNNPNAKNSIMKFSAKEILIEDCVFSENKYSNQIGGGIGIKFDCSNFTVTFRHCVFKENSGNVGGALQFGGKLSEQNENTGKLEIYDCRFEGNRAIGAGGALSFTSQKENIIQDCIFDNNFAERNAGSICIISSNDQYGYYFADEDESINQIINCQFIESTSNRDIKTMYIMNRGKSIVEGCTFTNVKKGGSGSQAMTQRQNHWPESSGLVEFTNTIFEASTGCRGIEIREDGFSRITECTFKLSSSQNSGNAIYLNSNSGINNEIYNNTFSNCGGNINYYVIKCDGAGINFYENRIIFDDPSNSCGCIEINFNCETSKRVNHRIHDNHFHDCQVNSASSNGIVHYNCNKCAQSSNLIMENNIFEKNKGRFAAFYIEAVLALDIIFENNSIQNNDPGAGSYLCGFNFKGTYKQNDIFTMINNKFINNTCSSPYGGGIGFWTQNKESSASNTGKIFKFEFIDCLFEGNRANYSPNKECVNGNGGAVQIGYSATTAITSPFFKRCTFLRNKAENGGGALSISVAAPFGIEDCVFNDNTANINPTENYTYGGGAICYRPDDIKEGGFPKSEIYNISNSTFRGNTANNAHAIYVGTATTTAILIDENCQFIDNGNTDNTIVSEASNFIVQNSFFRNENPTSSSRSIEVKLGNIKIENAFFYNVNHANRNYPGTTIYLASGSSANINNCLFSDCGSLYNDPYFVIYSENRNSIITDSTFNFTDSNHACGGIRIKNSGKITIKNNQFIKVGGYAAFQYNGELAQSSDDVNIERNTFDNLQAGKKAAVLRGVTNNVRFNGNTIKNMPNAGYIVELYLANLNSYTFSDNTFSNLHCNSRHGGGAGLWIQNQGSALFNLLIEGCTFENSIALATETLNGFGGGLQIGHTASTSKINLNINDCIFRGNKAHKHGGALSIGVQNSYTITNCVFENNVGGTESNENVKYYGGAVHIDPTTNGKSPDTITFSQCRFQNNTAPDASALYAFDMQTTDLIIQENTIFKDNCEKNKQSNVSAIITDSRSLSIDSCTFTHTNIATSSRALETYSITTRITNTLFEKCANAVATLPNAVWINEKVLSCQIENCNFINNGNVRGDVIRTETRDFLFDNSTIEFSTTTASTRGMFVPYYCKLSIFNSSFIKCVFNNASNHCAALEYHGHGSTKPGYTEDIRIEGSTFDSNHGAHTSHAIFDRVTTYPILYNLTFKGSIRGKYTLTIFFDFLPQEEYRVENIIFENNYFENLDGGGSGIWISQYNAQQTTRDTWPLTFDKCTFRNNHAKQSGGAIAYGNSPTLTFISLTFNDCKFIDNLCDSTGTTSPGGGALWFNSQEPVNISNCVFTGNQATQSETRAAGAVGYGHAIYAAPRSLINVENCKFIDNGADGLESVIQISGQQFNLTNCEISYTEVGKSCRGIYIDFPGIVNIVNTKFINCGKNNNVPAEGGGILYKANSDSVLEEQINIQGCTFDNCRAANGCAMLFHASVAPSLQGNKIINQQTGKYVISIFYTTFQDYSIVENMDFIGGRGGAEDGGASGIWIANNRDISNGRPAELIFRNCRWEDNYSPFKGGALHYGNSKTLIGTELTFENCRFINNRAAEAGGAVSIATISPSIFRNCEFNGNIVEKKTSSSITKGAAIYIDSETPLCLVSGCTFTNSSADEGNAIYASTKVLALHIQDNTRIRNCGSSGSCITVESQEFFFLNSQITFDNINKASRGILIKTRTVIRISDSKFVKCSYCTAYPTDSNRQGQGGAILIQRYKVETDTQEDVQLLHSTFDACKSDNGCSIMFWVETNPIIRGNTITNHNYNKYIFTIIRGTNFADQFTIENCSFVKNKFSNKQKDDGGGSALWIANQQFFNEGELSQLLFKDCNWTKNAGVYGGAFSYGKSNTVKFIQLEFQNCHFENNQATGDQGGALHLTTAVPVTIQGCTFYNNKCVNNIQNFGGDQALGGAIYFDTNATSVNILNTTFRKNSAQNGNAIFVSQITPFVEMQDTHFLSNSNGNVGSQVAHQGVELRASNCNFDYQVVTLHSKGVDILSKSLTTFFNCNFTLCETPYDKGGALFIQDQLNSPNNERLTLDGCIFDNCNSSAGAAIYASLSSSPEIKRCTIKNNVQGCSIFILTFTSKIPQLKIDNCTFQNNEYLNTEEKPDCGGSGIWISNVYQVEFSNCYFINNKADYVGGALAYGHDKELAEISIIFDSCFFEENKCNGKYGGALYLVNSQTKITDCTFRGNKPLGSNEIKGGDIYVDATSGGVTISDSHFESSTNQINEGNAIYCSSNTDKLSISNTNFNDCGISGTVITSYAKDNTITSTNVEFTEAANEKSARGLALYLIPESITMIQDCYFINCYFNTQDNNNGGGGLYIKYNGETEMPPDNFVFDGCQFIGTVSNIGAAVYLDLFSQITLKGITISECASNNNILYIKYANQAECTTLDNCRFINNRLRSSTDGGGSGILIPQTQKISFSACVFINNSATGNGGAFAYYNNQESKNTELDFNGCTFNGNNAQSNGGALYLVTNQPISIIGCFFDSNTANGNSGALYIDSKANIKLERLNIARNKASSKNAALYVNNAQTLEFNNNTISDNTCPSSPSSVEINNEGTANIAENNFDFNRQSDSQYQISLTGSSSSAVCNFNKNCFTHKGQITNNNLVHILSSHAGQINVPAGNCFDSGQYNSLQHNGGPSSVGENIFDCKKCGEIYIPTPAPEATPTATRQMTSKPTDVPVPTDKPYIPTPVATPHPTGDSGVVTSTSASSNVNPPSGDESNKGKKKKVNIGMIAGIVAAVVVVIVVVIILLWLFIFRRRNSNNSPQGTMNSAPQGMDDTISGVSGVNTTPQDDPIWAGATATHDNPLFNGSDDQDDDQMMHTGFEESWGENVI